MVTEVGAWCTVRLLEIDKCCKCFAEFFARSYPVRFLSLLYICCSSVANPVGWCLTMRKAVHCVINSSLTSIEIGRPISAWCWAVQQWRLQCIVPSPRPSSLFSLSPPWSMHIFWNIWKFATPPPLPVTCTFWAHEQKPQPLPPPYLEHAHELAHECSWPPCWHMFPPGHSTYNFWIYFPIS